MLARLIIRAYLMRKTLVLLVCIGMYPYVSRMYPCVSRMYSYVSVCSVCYSYVLVWCFSHDLEKQANRVKELLFVRILKPNKQTNQLFLYVQKEYR